MLESKEKFCVFCGCQPSTKTREHVIPYWLLEWTGDPSRIVTFGQNFAKEKEAIRYSWSNFVAPACRKCNEEFGRLEDHIKPSIKALEKREGLSVSAYIELLDWLDKVRIGIWFIRHMIENHPIKITPNFHISSRIAKKDRMLALYVFDSNNKGINLFGSDSLIFNSMPSCFGFRINNILLLNVSSDFFCSKGCGLPHPASTRFLMGGENDGKMKFEGINYAEHVTNPITSMKLLKPVVWLYQPIKLPSSDPIFKGGYYGHTNPFDSRIMERTLNEKEDQGALFRQYEDHVEILKNLSASIEFDPVVGEDCAMLKDIAASVYDIQRRLYCDIRREWIEPEKPGAFEKKYQKLKIDNAIGLAEMYRNAN